MRCLPLGRVPLPLYTDDGKRRTDFRRQQCLDHSPRAASALSLLFVSVSPAACLCIVFAVCLCVSCCLPLHCLCCLSLCLLLLASAADVASVAAVIGSAAVDIAAAAAVAAAALLLPLLLLPHAELCLCSTSSDTLCCLTRSNELPVVPTSLGHATLTLRTLQCMMEGHNPRWQVRLLIFHKLPLLCAELLCVAAIHQSAR